jgi:hypothetical protein
LDFSFGFVLARVLNPVAHSKKEDRTEPAICSDRKLGEISREQTENTQKHTEINRKFDRIGQKTLYRSDKSID